MNQYNTFKFIRIMIVRFPGFPDFASYDLTVAHEGGSNLESLVIKLVVSTVVFLLGFFLWAMAKQKWKHENSDGSADGDKQKKGLKKRKTLFFLVMLIAGWYFVSSIISYLSGSGGVNIDFEMFSPATKIAVGGRTFGIADTTLLLSMVTGIVFVLALLFRFLAVPRFSDTPKGLQNAMEAAVEAIDKFTCGAVGKKYGLELAPYMMSLAVLMIGSAMTELFGKRPPTSDLLVTGTMGLVTLVLINVYALRSHGLMGRIRSMSGPVKAMSPLMLVLKVISDIAVPVSLACRLFGNMLGGMIVMDLLKSSLGGYGLGVSSVAGLWFNLFHPLIQTYIFIVLTLTFINEAAE